MLERGASFGTAVAVASGFVYISSHISPVVISSRVSIYMTVCRLTAKRRRM